jgi:hypothetical protein
MSAETEALAAEYVLGTLDSDERAQAQGLLAADESFVAKVKVWERRLGELHLMVEPVEPDGRVWQRIKAKMPEVAPIAEVAPAEPAPEPEPAPASSPPPLPPAPTVPAPSVPEAASPATTSAAANFDAVLAAITEPLPPPAPPPPPPAPAPPSAEAAPRTLVAPAVSPAVVPPPPSAPAPVLTPGVTRAPPVEGAADEAAVVRGRLTRWRVFAALMTLVVLSAAALVAAWRFVPDRLPPMLQPVALMRLIGVNIGTASLPARPPAPPESQYDE